MDLTTKLADLKVKTDTAQDGMISGYASTFNNIDAYGDTIAPGAFKESLQKHLQDGTKVPLLFEHDRSITSHIGEITQAEEDEQGLRISAVIDTDSESGVKAHRLVKAGRIRGLSIGFNATEVEPSEIDGTPVNKINKIDLKEVSLVLNPADSQALVSGTKSVSDSPRLESVDGHELLTALEGSDPDTSLSELAQRTVEAEAIAKFRSELLRGDLTAAQEARRGIHKSLIPEAEDLIKTIATAASNDDRRLTSPEQRALRTAQKFISTTKKNAEANKIFDQIRHAKSAGASHMEGHTLDTKSQLPVSRIGHERVAEAAVKAMRGGEHDVWNQKAIPASGDVLVPAMTSIEIQKSEAPALSILELIPHERVASPQFSYLRQTARTNNADVVETGAVKPTSDYGFERVDAALQVVAHLAKGIDKYLLSDIAALNSFLASEMTAGVMERVEGLIVEALETAGGAKSQAFDTDVFATTRSGLTQLQSSGLNPAAFVLSPSDWQSIELSKTSGSGQFIFGATPVNQIERTLWSVPTVVSHRVPTGAGYLISQESIKLYSDGNLEAAWNSSGEDFSRNQLTFRVEGRFKPVVTRESGVVKLDLSA